MVNVNDAPPIYTPGKWYGYTGGACPIPSDVAVEVLLSTGQHCIAMSWDLASNGPGWIAAFKVPFTEDWRDEPYQRLYINDEPTDQWRPK